LPLALLAPVVPLVPPVTATIASGATTTAGCRWLSRCLIKIPYPRAEHPSQDPPCLCRRGAGNELARCSGPGIAVAKVR